MTLRYDAADNSFGVLPDALMATIGSLGQERECLEDNNDGATDASDVLVRFYAGDPEQGGSVIDETLIPGPIPAGGQLSVSVDTTQMPFGLVVTVHAVVDPDDTIIECNDGNNTAVAGAPASCEVF